MCLSLLLGSIFLGKVQPLTPLFFPLPSESSLSKTRPVPSTSVEYKKPSKISSDQRLSVADRNTQAHTTTVIERDGLGPCKSPRRCHALGEGVKALGGGRGGVAQHDNLST